MGGVIPTVWIPFIAGPQLYVHVSWWLTQLFKIASNFSQESHPFSVETLWPVETLVRPPHTLFPLQYLATSAHFEVSSHSVEGPSSPLASHPSTDASPLDRFRRRPSPLKLVLPPPPVAPIKAEGPEGTTPGPPTPSRGASGALKDPDELLTVQASGPMKVLGQRGSSLLSFSAEAAETDGESSGWTLRPRPVVCS